jgi:hypothetical protein
MFYVAVAGKRPGQQHGAAPCGERGVTSSAAMFRPGRILQIGGNSNGAMIVDINGLSTPLTALSANMSSQRQWVNATILADGRVVATGGSEVPNELVGVNNSAEVWNPATALAGRPERCQCAPLSQQRLLLPDGSVLVSGGGAAGRQLTSTPRLLPSYLYDASGAFAARPTIKTWPATLDVGTRFTLKTGGSGTIKRVTW